MCVHQRLMRSLLVLVAFAGGPTTAVRAADPPIQSLLLRSTTVTCNLEESIAFYRDVLGQEVMLRARAPATNTYKWLGINRDTKVDFVTMRGSAVYPGGEIMGGRIGFLAILDPDDPACRQRPDAQSPGVWGTTFLPFRVANLDAIVANAKAKGVKVFHGPAPSGSRLSRNLFMKDPNGNLVEVFELNIQPIPPSPGE